MAEMEATAKAERPKLFSYWRSSCSHRARIALNFKGSCSSAPLNRAAVFRMDWGIWDTGLGWIWLALRVLDLDTVSVYAGVEYEYKAVNLLKGEQSDPGGLVLGTATLQPYAAIASIWSVRLGQ